MKIESTRHSFLVFMNENQKNTQMQISTVSSEDQESNLKMFPSQIIINMKRAFIVCKEMKNEEENWKWRYFPCISHKANAKNQKNGIPFFLISY